MREFSELYYETVECVRCNLCLDKCPVVRTLGVDKTPLYLSVYGAMGTRFDLDKTEKDALACIDCYECEAACPPDVPIADTMCYIRGIAVKEGLMSDGMRAVMEKARTGKNILGEPIAVEESRGEVAFFPGYAGEIDNPVLQGFDAICEAAGVSGTIISGAADSGYLIDRAGFGEDVEKFVEKNLELFRNSGAKTIVTPCSYSYQAFLSYYPDEFTYIHISEFIHKLLEEGKLDLTEDGVIVAYHDPHFLTRVNGVKKPPRQVILAASGCLPAEPQRTGEFTAASGIGGGLGLFDAEQMERVSRSRASELAELGCKTVVSGCALEKYALKEIMSEMDIDVVELTEYISGRIKYIENCSVKGEQ